jgi:radical SAM-linked protein
MPVAPTPLPLQATSYKLQVSHFRVFYSKMGDLRFISHLDLMRMIFRLVRRNHLPVVYTQGYNPHPKISLGPPLPLGVEGEMEFFDMSVSGEITQEELSALLKKNFEGAVEFRQLKLIDASDKINWESEGVEILEIKPSIEQAKSFEERLRAYHEVQSFPITKIRNEKPITSDLKDIILDMHWDKGVLFIEKKLRGAGIYDILNHVFGLERTHTYGMCIVRKELKTNN